MLKILMDERDQLVTSLYRIPYDYKKDREMILEEIAKIDQEIEEEKRIRGIFKE